MSPPTVYLAPHIHMARCHGDIVVLDVQADSYALLNDAAPEIRPGPGPGRITVAPGAHGDLLALGLLAGFPDDRAPLPALTGEIAPAAGRPRRAGLAAAALNSVVASAVFARTPFAGLIRIARARRTPDRSVDEAAIGRCVGDFLAVHPWIPFEGDCLQRGFRLHHHLHRSGIAARWVFGVRTWPFLAHCWVQVGDKVVGDTHERVGGFSPILAV